MIARSVCYLIIAISLTACVPEAFIKHDYVEVPTPVPCVTWQPTRANSVFDATDAHADVWQQIKALLIDRENDQRFIEGQEAVIEGCK